jgi:hypothetical protein
MRIVRPSPPVEKKPAVLKRASRSHFRSLRMMPIFTCAFVIVLITTATIIMYHSLRESRDTIRRNDMFTLRNAIELYKLNHQKNFSPSDTNFTGFAESIIPLFTENLPTDPGNFSYYYVRDKRNQKLYTIGGRDEVRGNNATFRYGTGSSEIDLDGVDGNPATVPQTGVEFGFR